MCVTCSVFYAYPQGVEVHVGDSVVPHTPVLNERKQLAMTQRVQTLPSTPADQPPYVVPESSLAVATAQASGGLECLSVGVCVTEV